MRSMTDLLPDIRIAAPGVPDFMALYYLTRALSEFLDRSEAWRQFIENPRPLDEVVNGLVSWANHLDDPTKRWARIKRIDMLRYYNDQDIENEDGEEIEFLTEHQLQKRDWKWRDRLGARPLYFTRADEQPALTDEVSLHTVRLYPQPYSDALGEVRARVVVVTDVVANFGLSGYDGQIPELPDRVFYPWRYGITCGALAQLYVIPGKDWTNAQLAASHMIKFEQAIALAQSRADRDYNNALLVTQYGGL
jgi:hypothetical protein